MIHQIPKYFLGRTERVLENRNDRTFKEDNLSGRFLFPGFSVGIFAQKAQLNRNKGSLTNDRQKKEFRVYERK